MTSQFILQCVALWTLWLLLAVFVKADEFTGKPGYGFIGYGITMYKPTCAFACHDSITAPLNCSTEDAGDMSMSSKLIKRVAADDDSNSNDTVVEGDGWIIMNTPSGACLCNNDFYLQTLAYCMSTKCAAFSISVPDLEEYWLTNIPGSELVQPVPKVSYQQALGHVTQLPTTPLDNDILLNYTAMVPDDLWLPIYNSGANFEEAEDIHERYGLVVFLGGAVIPIGVSALVRLIPWPASLLSKLHAYLIDPPVIGSRHSSPLAAGFIVPTCGQALFIAYIWLINLVLSAANYHPVLPNAWLPSIKWEVLAYLGNRFGVLSFANLPLLILYSGRNNVLLWLTNWSHSTFLLLHRWISFICILQAILHSLIYLYVYTNEEGYNHATESKLPYWYWGIIGTLSLIVLVPASSLQIRQRLYNHVFLPSHTVLAILTLVSCFLHIILRFERQWGYETWIYMAAAVWAFDRLARGLRIAGAMISGRTFFGRAFVSVIDEEYYRLDLVPGVAASAGGYLFLHFPTVSKWRFWESHPFSNPGIICRGDANRDRVLTLQNERRCKPGTPQTYVNEIRGNKVPSSDLAASLDDSSSRRPAAFDTNEAPVNIAMVNSTTKTTLFIRKSATGLTSRLVSHAAAAAPSGLRVLIEPSYGRVVTFIQEGQPGSQFAPSESFANILCIAGGVGITAIIPLLKNAGSFSTVAEVGSKKVYWGVRSVELVRAVEDALDCETDRAGIGYGETGAGVLARKWPGDVQAIISIGRRLDLRALLEEELSISEKNPLDRFQKGTTVVVCGPPAMADDVRCVVTGLARKGVLVRLIVESFSW